MKSLFRSVLIVLASFFASVAVHAATVTLEWDASAPDEMVTSYLVYQQTGASDFQLLQTVTPPASGNPRVVLTDVTPGAHTYVIAAANIWSEGEKSDPVSTPPGLPGKVRNLRIVTITVP